MVAVNGAVSGRHASRGCASDRGLLALAAVVSLTISVAVHLPVLRAEPMFAAVNSAVVASLVVFGLYLARRQGERVTGYAFAGAGANWIVAGIDVYAPWGPIVVVYLGGITYVLLIWGILRYRRPRPETRSERLFVPIAAFLIVGLAVITAPFIPPDAVGYPPGTWWPLLPPELRAPLPAVVLLGLGYQVAAVWFCWLLTRVLRAAPPISRPSLRPMVLFGVLLAVGSAVIQAASLLLPDVIPAHLSFTLVGFLFLGLIATLFLSMNLQQLVGSRLVERLPPIRTPEATTDYLRDVTGDSSVELLYWAPEVTSLIDERGERRLLEQEARSGRFWTWIEGSDGARIGMLVGDGSLAGDPGAVAALRRVVSIIAENTQLNALLRMRVAQLTATRMAEQLAFSKAREEFRRDLHDGLQQTIAAVRMDLDGLHDIMHTAADHAVVEDLEAKLTFALKQVHSLKSGGQPPDLEFGLKSALDRTVAQLRLVAHVVVPETDLGILTLPVFYLVRESLTNVHKYARASRVQVSIAADGRTVEICVRDDGVGGVAARPDGGIAGMRARVLELGGTLRVSSPVGGGTTITASIPCVSS